MGYNLRGEGCKEIYFIKDIMRKNQKVKASLLTLILALFAVAAIAITKEVMKNNAEVGNDEFVHWNFVGADDPQDNDPTDPNQYERASGPESCLGSSIVCQIYAPEDGTSSTPKPNMNATEPSSSETISDRIQDALPFNVLILHRLMISACFVLIHFRIVEVLVPRLYVFRVRHVGFATLVR